MIETLEKAGLMVKNVEVLLRDNGTGTGGETWRLLKTRYSPMRKHQAMALRCL